MINTMDDDFFEKDVKLLLIEQTGWRMAIKDKEQNTPYVIRILYKVSYCRDRCITILTLYEVY